MRESTPTNTAQVFDASSEQALAESLERLKRALPEERRQKFHEAVVLISFNTPVGTNTSVTSGDVLRESRSVLHGKTADEIVITAERLARRLKDAYDREQQKATAAPIPDAIPVTSQSLTCRPLVSTTIAPAYFRSESLYEVSETSLYSKDEQKREQLMKSKRIQATSQPGSDHLAISVGPNVLKMRTEASLKAGHTEAATHRVVWNDDRVVVAVLVETQGPNQGTISAFTLKKENGLAVWSKSLPGFIASHEPHTQTHYFACR